jgi:hypothetical protein
VLSHIWSPLTPGGGSILGGYTGTAAGTLPSLTGSASGSHGYLGIAAGVLPSLVGAASGSFGFFGTGAGTLQSLTGSASGDDRWQRSVSVAVQAAWAPSVLEDPTATWTRSVEQNFSDNPPTWTKVHNP